jgi:hypothetical protein
MDDAATLPETAKSADRNTGTFHIFQTTTLDRLNFCDKFTAELITGVKC